MRPNFFHHLHPPTIPAPQARLRYTLGAGGFSVFLVLVIILTGILEMFYYIPTPQGATASIQTITYLVPFGGVIRNMHYLAGQLLVIVAGIHLLRVIFTGAYAPPRRANYLIGLGLFITILVLDFSGYVLRWDEGVRWALIAGTNLLASIPLVGEGLYRVAIGAPQPGLATLTRFYTWHIFGFTLVAIFLGVWHIFKVRRDGGVAVPPPELRTDSTRITRFELARREGVAALLGLAVLIVLSLYLPAPVAPPMDEFAPLGEEARAPWFFLWVQKLLEQGDAFVFGVLVPLGVIGLLAALPWLPVARPAELGRWFPRGNRLAQILVAGLLLVIIGLTVWMLLPAGEVVAP